MAHKHAALMALYAQDAMETNKPHERWQMQYECGTWADMHAAPSWLEVNNYRRKPERISVELECGEVVSWPKPYTGTLLFGSSYWSVGLDGVHLNAFNNDIAGNLLLSNGMVYLVKEDAQEALQARIKIFTQGMK